MTHIITDETLWGLLRTCGLEKLSDIRADVPILKWSWVTSPIVSRYGKFAQWHNHASFKERVLYDPETEAQIKNSVGNANARGNARTSDKGKGKARAPDPDDHDSESEEEYSKIS